MNSSKPRVLRCFPKANAPKRTFRQVLRPRTRISCLKASKIHYSARRKPSQNPRFGALTLPKPAFWRVKIRVDTRFTFFQRATPPKPAFWQVFAWKSMNVSRFGAFDAPERGFRKGERARTRVLARSFARETVFASRILTRKSRLRAETLAETRVSARWPPQNIVKRVVSTDLRAFTGAKALVHVPERRF